MMSRIFGRPDPTPLRILRKVYEKSFSSIHFDKYQHYLNRDNTIVRIGILNFSLDGRLDVKLWYVPSWPIFTSRKILELRRLKYEVRCGEEEHKARTHIFDAIMEYADDDIQEDVAAAIIFNPQNSYRDIVEYILGL